MLHSRRVEPVERLAGGLLLGVLLRPAGPRAHLLTVDERRARERAVVRRADGPQRDVLDTLAALRELLLERRLLVDRLGQRLLDPRLEGLDHGVGELVQSTLEVQPRERD